MISYETVFILRPELDEEKAGEVVEKFKSLIENHGGEITKLERWGKRRLAYDIDHQHEGVYMIIQFKAESAVARELDRVFKITDGILRHIIVQTAA
ncbi:30S ribosomal protein S6 [Desulfotomaculum copahuensis]|uniref:Small ribosomal subunit protein bS6 n=1 Tax=Desulfotomaculum copahuensis TaxID=1838280 RepID=A0A1B7LDA5_9FIRM|nr:30S ribosomal protein S6 [Desulfotomaculum copahuensis]OAT80869.1 30S ribosomal protein S6 [Desulfotomaculum copahuensis]